MAKSTDEQKALLKKVYDKNKDRLTPIPAVPFSGPKGGEPYKMFKERRKKELEQGKKSAKAEALRKFRMELSKGSDKKLSNKKGK